jgi:Resolvase, N terminal domain
VLGYGAVPFAGRTSRARPGLDQALVAVREGDTLTVTKLDRLARSVPDALDILGQLSARGVRFALGGSVYDWTTRSPGCSCRSSPILVSVSRPTVYQSLERTTVLPALPADTRPQGS